MIIKDEIKKKKKINKWGKKEDQNQKIFTPPAVMECKECSSP